MKMKICILSAFEDSMQKDTGASVRIYNLAKGLAKSGNDVKVVLPMEKTTYEFIDGAKVYGFKGLIPRPVLEILRKLANVTRPTSIYFYDFLFAFRVGRLVRETDIVQMEQQSSGGLMIPFIKKVLKRPVVVDCHDVFQALRLQHTSTLRRMYETFLERLAYRNADLLLTVSESEKKCLITAGFQKCKIEVVPNGVDTEFFVKSPEHTETRKKYGLEGFRAIVFVGNLAYLPNREAIQTLSSAIAPRVLDEIKEARFLVVGRRQDRIELPNIIFTGFVDDLSAVLSISDVAVAPLSHGSGTRLKILEYFSCGLPVVSTSVGAEGLDVTDGVNIIIEDNMDEFSAKIIELLNDHEFSSKLGKRARELVVEKYDWREISDRLNETYCDLLSRKS